MRIVNKFNSPFAYYFVPHKSYLIPPHWHTFLHQAGTNSIIFRFSIQPSETGIKIKISLLETIAVSIPVKIHPIFH